MSDKTATPRSLHAILYAVAQTVPCNSASLALLEEEKHALRLAVAVNARSVGDLVQVEKALGFAVSGLQIPLKLERSLLVRALREERVFVTTEVSEMAGGALPADIVSAVHSIAGVRSFAVVPVLGRIRPLGVMLCERPGSAGFQRHERDLMISYAERVGAELETDALQNTAQRLEQLGALAVPPPLLWTCAILGEPKQLLCQDPPFFGQPLQQALRLPPTERLLNDAVLARLLDGETVVLNVSANRPSVVATITTPWPLRLTLRKMTQPSTEKMLCAVAVEDLGWSEHVRRESLLAKERLAKVMGSVGDAILTLDRQAVIQQVNESSQTVLGLLPGQLYGRSVLDLAATPRGRQQLTDLLDALPRLGFAETELRFLRPTDQKRPRFLGHVFALLLGDETGSYVGAVFRIHDQTERRREDAERKQLRLRLLQTERLSALGEMAARIAHEVRNPLVSIGAAAQVIAEELPADSPVLNEAVAIGNEVRRLDRILQNVLRFAKPTRAKAQRTEVTQVLGEVIELVKNKAPGLTLRYKPGKPGPHGPIFALIDPDLLRQVLWNVLINACEASSPGDGVRSVVECAVQTQTAQKTVLISVADRGPGISAAVRRRVFDPFFSTKTRGTGLGLAICKQIVDDAGGRIRILNRQMGGTRLILHLRS